MVPEVSGTLSMSMAHAYYTSGVQRTLRILMGIPPLDQNSGQSTYAPRSAQRSCGTNMASLLMSQLVISLSNSGGILNPFQPFTNNFPRADIHELLSCDLLHQVIKGTFKDHLVTWVEDYLKKRLGKTAAARIMSDIDRR